MGKCWRGHQGGTVGALSKVPDSAGWNAHWLVSSCARADFAGFLQRGLFRIVNLLHTRSKISLFITLCKEDLCVTKIADGLQTEANLVWNFLALFTPKACVQVLVLMHFIKNLQFKFIS